MAAQKTRRQRVPETFSVKRAHAAQLEASKHVIPRDVLPERIRYVAGVDVAYSAAFSIGAVAVLDYDSLALVESTTAKVRTLFPYIPTLLSFREIPPSIAAVRKLHLQPDVFLVDGQGVMHPYRLGFASHLGVVLNVPTIGVAKTPLIGKIQPSREDNVAFIVDKGETVGATLSTKKGRKPLYVSVGHMVSLERAVEIVKHCLADSWLPEPIHRAHVMAAEEKRKVQESR